MDTKDLEKRVNNRNAVSYWKDGVLVGKRCTKCGKDKEISEFAFRDKRKNTHRNECKECGKEYFKQRYETNKEYYQEKHRQYYKANKEHYKEYKKQYCETNKKHKKEYDERYYKVNKEHIKGKRKQWRTDNAKNLKQRYKAKQKNNIIEITKLLHQLNPMFKRLDIKAYGIVYKITNIKTGRIYIGQTVRKIDERYGASVIKGWIKDRKRFKNQKFLNELKEEDFTLGIIDFGICQYHLDKLEAMYIEQYNSYNNGYNNQSGNHRTDDGLEEFEQILKENNLEFKNGKLIQIKNTHHNG